MNLMFAMVLSVGIKAISAVVELAIQILLTNGIGVSAYGSYVFYIGLVEGTYFLLFSGSVKLNTFYLSTPCASLRNFKKKYVRCYLAPVVGLILTVSLLLRNPYGVLAACILGVYYFAFDTSGVFFSRGYQLPGLLGEYLLGRLALLTGVLTVLRLNLAHTLVLFSLYGTQFLIVLLWYSLHRKKLKPGSEEIQVPLRKLAEFQISDVASSLVSYSPTILQYLFGGAFTAGFSGIISVVRSFTNFISGPTEKVFLPSFSQLYKAGERQKLEQSYLMIVQIQMVFVGTIGAILLIFPRLFLSIFSPDLVQYADVFSGTAACLLLVSGMGPVTGMLQMTENEKICNRNQWTSIAVMVLVWIVLRREPLFAIYGICVQALVEGGLKYYSVCRWFGKSIIPVRKYILLWLPVLLLRLLVERMGWTYSWLAGFCCVAFVFLWNLSAALMNPLVKAELLSKLVQIRKK